MTANVRIGDPVSCGDVVAQGSGDCFMNGLPVARVGDLTAGHCYPAVPVLVGAPTVYTNNILVAMVGNPIPSHSCGDSSHSGNVANGSPNCFVLQTGAVVSKGTDLVQEYIRSNVPLVVGAVQHDDDPDSDPVYVTSRRQLDSAPFTEPKMSTPISTPVKSQIIVPDCSDIEAYTEPFPGSFQLSTNFTLAQLTTDTLISNYPIRNQKDLTTKEIVCNLKHLCINVLEPLYAKYGANLVINSGFRHGTGASQHYKGQAVDISFKDAKSSDAIWARAQEIPSLVTFDQFIFEQNMSIWYHISFNTDGNRTSILTKPRGEEYYAGLRRILA